MHAPRTRFLLLLPLLLAVGCDGESPQELVQRGNQALGIGNSVAAADAFESALTKLSEGSDDWIDAKLGWCEAQAKLDANLAADEMLALASAAPSKIDDRDFNRIASALGPSKLNEAVRVLEVAKKAYPESPHLNALGQKLAQAAKQSGNADAESALRGLGYVGGE
jgi:hypothetical protein